MGQLSALLFKNAALLLRQRKSLVTQSIAIFVLLLLAGVFGLLFRPGDGYVEYQYPNAFNGNLPRTGCSSNLPANYPDECSYSYYGLFTQPPSSAMGTDSPGILTNTSFITGVKSGLLGRWPQTSARVYSDDGYDWVSWSYVISPFFAQVDSADAMDNAIEDQINAQRAESNYNVKDKLVPNLGLAFNSLDYSTCSIDYDLQMDLSVEYNSQIRYDMPTGYNDDIQGFLAQVASGFFSEAAQMNVTFKGQAVAMANRYINRYASVGPLFSFLFVSPTLMLMLPLFVLPIVVDRSNRTLELNKLMGMSMVKYWLSHLIFDFIVFAAELLVVIVFSTVFIMPIIWDSLTVTLPLWLLWGFAQVGLGLFIGSIFKGERSATLVSYLVMFLTIVCAYPLNIWVFANKTAPWWYMWFPPWTYLRGFYLIENSFVNGGAMTITTISSEMVLTMCLLPLQGLFCLIMAFYLEQVTPKEWGKQRPLYFPISYVIHLFKKPSAYSYKQQEANEESSLLLDAEAEDCRAERKRAEEGGDGLVMSCIDIHKSFGTKTALHRLSLAIQNEETFGLLGPNGAGKTTLLSILSGMLKPDSGTAFINGYNIFTQADLVQDSIGVCPQFDILWDDLTVDEHIRFYYRMKNIPLEEKMHIMVHRMCESVGLAEHMNKTAGSLSGGMQRKLSIAIALVGEPRLIMLDEPSSGLDPEARREIWDIINAAQKGRSFIITTHNMEEADVLCSRIGILTRGKLACVGSQLYLKNRFGKGYTLSVSCRPSHDVDDVDDILQTNLPMLQKDSSLPGQLSYLIPNEDLDIGHIFNFMREAKESMGVQDYSLSQTSLEEVFLKILDMDEYAEAQEDLLS